ncbi:14243_t:CDS:2, partial [Racocetra persica]
IMQASTNKRKGENVITQNAWPTETKLSRQAHTRKNKKFRHDQKQAEMFHELDVDIPLLIDDIRKWTSIPLCSSDRVSTKKNKAWYDISAKELLIETLIREAKSSDSNSFELPEILSNFLSLIYTDIIRETDVGIKGSSPNITNKQLWVVFSQWLGLKRQDGSLKRKHVRQHLRLLWKKLWYAHNIQSDRDFQDLFDTATIFNTRREKAHLIISACHNPQSISELVQFKHIAEPEYITNLSG